jgi:uncharacterized delta-60 repeat protein
MSNDNVEAARYAGQLDPDFGIEGKTEIEQAGGFYGAAMGLDSLYAVGFAGGPNYKKFVVSRLDSSGQPDLSFGSSGSAIDFFQDQGVSTGRGVIVTSDNKLIVAGKFGWYFDGIGFARFNAENGTLDDEFSADGRVVHNLFAAKESGAENVRAVENFAFPDTRSSGAGMGKGIVLPDGKIIFILEDFVPAPVGYSIIARFQKSPDELDRRFGGVGFVRVTHPDYKNGLTQVLSVGAQRDDKYVACGLVDNGGSAVKAMLVRYDNDGSLDDSFGESGFTVIEPLPNEPQASARLKAVVQQSNGNIIAVGSVGNDYGLLVNVDARGKLNENFNEGRPVYFKIGPYDTSFESVDLQADGKIVVAGWAGESAGARNVNMIVMRYLEDGKADLSFGTNNYGYVQPDQRPCVGWGVLVDQRDNKILVVGELLLPGPGLPDHGMVWRLLS